jgi:transketolase
MTVPSRSLDELCINTIRVLAADMAQKANSGHPGLPMGAAPMGYFLWLNHLVHDPSMPDWPDRDRFVLSPGHGSMLQYALMHLSGHELSLDDLKAFRQWGSRTPGHPEFRLTPGVEATTGPLGQGAANVVGMAIAERMLASRFNRPGHEIVDHFTWAIVSDGDLMEGISAEAASLAGQLRLGKLACLYDANDVSLDGPTSITFSAENVAQRYEAYGWHVQVVKDADNDYEAIDWAIARCRAETSRPSLVIFKTTIGYGSPNKQGTSAAHGAPLGIDEVALTKKNLGWDPDKHFHIPPEAYARLRSATERGKRAREDWQRRFAAYEKAFPQLAQEFRDTLAGKLPDGWDSALPVFQPGESQPTRNASGKALNAIARRVPWLVGGDADIGSSTKSYIHDGGWFDATNSSGRNIHFGVREHAMMAIANGMAYHGGVRPLVSTFFTFVDYMRPAIRVAALARLPVICVFSHDSLAVGEDGPTHQPVEQLASLRLMPNVKVVRPADPNESVEAWRWVMTYTDGPAILVFTRQNVPVIDRSRYAPASGLHRGAYVLADPANAPPQVILIATGSEVSLAIEAHERLAQEGLPTRVVSMPCWELFAQQPQAYRDEVLPPHIRRRVSVEAGVSFGWERWVGEQGVIVGVDRYGASAPGEVAMDKLGFNVQNVVEAVRRTLHSPRPAAS